MLQPTPSRLNLGTGIARNPQYPPAHARGRHPLHITLGRRSRIKFSYGRRMVRILTDGSASLIIDCEPAPAKGPYVICKSAYYHPLFRSPGGPPELALQ